MEKNLSLQKLPISHQRVLLRVDFNVPLDEKGNISDDTKIKAALPTIQDLLKKECSIVLMSHLGRPEGKKVEKYSLKPVAKRLSELLGMKVEMAKDCIGKEVMESAEKLKSGELLMLENLRFHPGEENPGADPLFAKQLASLGNYYVNDAFGCSHRAHASIVNLPQFFPKKCAMGFLLEEEIDFLGEKLKNPSRPFLALIGGAKVSTKMGVLKSLVNQVDFLLVGGGMAFTFLRAQGKSIGESLFEEGLLEDARKIIDLCAKKNVHLVLPFDVIAAKRVDANEGEISLFEMDSGVPNGWKGLDIGPKTVENFKTYIRKSKTIVWNGPMGVFENPLFAKGTLLMAEAIAQSGALTIAGGGETIAALEATPWAHLISHISTGGGASLEYIEYGTLPGIEALINS